MTVQPSATAPGAIHPVILSGGAGTRLWPLSRATYPKQLIPLLGERSLLQATALRATGTVNDQTFAAPLVVCNEEHRFIVGEQLRAVDQPPSDIVLEPIGRNTAPAAAVAALMVAETDPAGLILLMPSDHSIADSAAFHAAIATAAAAARTGQLVTFGITPERPETGYGYIRQGQALGDVEGAFAVARFVEKPDLTTAQSYLAEGGYLWNSGMFLFSAETFLSELERLQPAMLAACREALSNAARDLDFRRLDADAFATAPALSIDYAVMEHTDRAAVVPVDMGWSDVGAWDALWQIDGNHDTDGNVLVGDVIAHDSRNTYVRSDERLVALVGVEGLVVVTTDDAVLVARKDRAQEVKAIVDRLKADERHEHLHHTTVHRPWGWYRGIDAGGRFQVKHIMVNPGAKLSLQKHLHRAEHWVVVSGTARVTRGDQEFLLHENESTFIPQGEVHRLENPGKLPLSIIEVQSGSYLGEDDIIRLDDVYRR